nr:MULTISPECIES: hypothetical protein [Gammaproteobacteria]
MVTVLCGKLVVALSAP